MSCVVPNANMGGKLCVGEGLRVPIAKDTTCPRGRMFSIFCGGTECLFFDG